MSINCFWQGENKTLYCLKAMFQHLDLEYLKLLLSLGELEKQVIFFLGQMNTGTECLNGWTCSGALAKECLVPWKLG